MSNTKHTPGKVKVETISDESLKEIAEIRLRNAKLLYASRPFVTKTWMAMRGFPMSFLQANWKEITGGVI